MVGPTTSITRIGAVALLTLVQACGGAATTPTSTGPTPSPTTEPTPSLPADAAPDELQGRWSTLIGPGDNVTLIIGQTGYSIVRRGFSGHGHISVNGDQIEFSRANQCADGSGTCRWQISGGTLTFVPVGAADPCPRVSVLKEHDFKRLAS